MNERMKKNDAANERSCMQRQREREGARERDGEGGEQASELAKKVIAKE